MNRGGGACNFQPNNNFNQRNGNNPNRGGNNMQQQRPPQGHMNMNNNNNINNNMMMHKRKINDNQFTNDQKKGRFNQSMEQINGNSGWSNQLYQQPQQQQQQPQQQHQPNLNFQQMQQPNDLSSNEFYQDNFNSNQWQ